MRLRAPRPIWRRLGRQPGFVACAAIVLASLFNWIYDLFDYSSMAYPKRGLWYPLDPSSWLRMVPFYTQSAREIAPAVAVAWVTLALSGSWRPEASWIGRLGRGLGVLWIVASFMTSYRTQNAIKFWSAATCCRFFSR